jgi:hypothetical protein
MWIIALTNCYRPGKLGNVKLESQRLANCPVS